MAPRYWQEWCVPHIDSWIADRSARQDSTSEVPRQPHRHECRQSGQVCSAPFVCAESARNTADRPRNWPRLTRTPCAELPLSNSFLRKEVIQPQLPLRLPCYDFVPVASPTLGVCLLAVSSTTSGVTDSHDVTGGVYKARERIHRSMADLRLLATPTSCRRVAACNPN